MNTKLLRQQILDLAIRGKLVKQDPNDEPASVLLERIHAEKEQLILQGKIKKTKASATTDTPHYQNTPFDIPNSWQWVKLGEIANLCGGYAFKSTDIKGSVGYRVIRISDITLQGLSNTNIVRYSGNAVLPQFEIQANDILIAMTGGTVGKSLLLQELSEKMYINQRVAGVRTIIANPYYLYITIISTLIQDIIKYAKNSTNDNISMDDIYNFPIPLPPLAEQKRIVAEIEKWFALIDELDANKQDLQGAIKQVRAKVLDLAIHGKLVPQNPNDEPAIALLRRINPHYTPSDTSHYQNVPFDIPASWEWVLHNDIINLVGGSQPPKSNFSSENREGYIRLYQIRDYGTTPVPVYIPLDLAQKRTNKGDILLARYGGSLGKVFRAEYGAYNVAMTKVVVKYTGLIDIDFAYIYYLAPIYQHKLKTISRTAQVGFNEVDFFDLYFPLPPLAEQRRIVSEIERIFGVLDTIEENFR